MGRMGFTRRADDMKYEIVYESVTATGSRFIDAKNEVQARERFEQSYRDYGDEPPSIINVRRWKVGD